MDNGSEALTRLLEGAEPFVSSDAQLAEATKPSRVPKAANTSSAVARAMSAIRFLAQNGGLDLGDYDTWILVGIAFKNSLPNDEGFEAFLTISRDAPNFNGDAACRKVWDSIGEPANGQKLTIASYFARATAAGWQESSNRIADGNEGRIGLPKGTDPASFVVSLAETAGDEFWVDLEGKPHVTFISTLGDGTAVKRHAPVSGPTYLRTLESRFYSAAGTKVLTSEQGKMAIGLLAFRASESGAVYPAPVRVGQHGGKIYVDLGTPNGRAIEVDGKGWRIVPEAPVRFVRGSRGAMPDPEQGGSLQLFRDHFNVSEADLKRLIGFMIGVFNPDGSYPMLLTDGIQGSGKSNLNDKIVAVVDPPRQVKSARMSFNPKEQDLHLGALRVHVVYFDNVSTFSADAADALCRLSTGGGSGSRKLYTDEDYNELVVMRPVIITAIGVPTSRPDLLSRCIQITALPLTGLRRTERAVMHTFNRDRGKMLGFILDCVSAAVRNREDVEAAVEKDEIQLPRMADFAEFVEGASEKLKLARGGFSQLIEEGQSRAQTESVLGNPLGSALVQYFSQSPSSEIVGSATEVLNKIKPTDLNATQWPAPNALKRLLNRLAVGLTALGISWEVSEPSGHQNVSMYRIWADKSFRLPAIVPKNDPF